MKFTYVKYCSVLILIAMVTAMSSCAVLGGPTSIQYPGTEDGFSRDIAWYGKILADEKASPAAKARAHAKLGLLYAHYRNPSMDYSKAMEHIEAAMAMNNSIASDDGVRNFYNILSEIAPGSANGKRGSELKRLRAEATSLKEENEKLKLVIEQLNELEVELEQRRKLLK